MKPDINFKKLFNRSSPLKIQRLECVRIIKQHFVNRNLMNDESETHATLLHDATKSNNKQHEAIICSSIEKCDKNVKNIKIRKCRLIANETTIHLIK